MAWFRGKDEIMESGDFAVVEEHYTEDQIVEGLGETARTINRLMLSLLALGLFSLLAVGQPDAYLLDPAATVSVPSAGATTAKALLIVGPMLLIGVRIYLQIYVEHWRHLDTIANHRKIKRPIVVSPMQHSLLSFLVGAVLYLLVPVTLATFTWKAMAVPETWGYGLFVVTIFVSVAHLMQDWSREWVIRLYFCGNIAAVVGVIGAVPFLDDLRRPLNLRYADLHNTDLRNADLRNADIRQADLSGADLEQADIRDADLSRANLQGAYLRGANLQGADLSLANLQGVVLTRANLRGVVLTGVKLPEVDLRWANLQGTNLSEANLRGSNLSEADLRESNLSEANLQGANLSEANLERANLNGANLQETNFRKANLQWAELHNADLQGADLWFANLQEAQASNANLQRAYLFSANLQGASLWGAILTEANLGNANLQGVDLRTANLEGARLWEADLRDADLWGATLTGADLRRTRLEGTDLRATGVLAEQLEGACGNKDTKFVDTYTFATGPTIPPCAQP